MKAYTPAVILLILTASLALAGCTAPATDPKAAEMKAVAGELVSSINTGLGEMKAGLANTSGELSTSGLSGTHAEEILSRNLQHYPWAFSSITVSRDGVVGAAVPGSPEVQPGLNMSGRVQIDRANAARVPLVGSVFRMAEGPSAVSQSYPVFSPSGEYLGYIDITYAPEIFLDRYIGPVINRTGYDVWVIQADGTEIYDTSPDEIGKNIITDVVYSDPSVKEVSASIVKEPSASGKYTFWDRDWNGNVTKTAVWETAGIDGAAWRVGVTREESAAT
ncbi:MAG: hypothetical protein ACYDDV_02410 [Methanoregula sp.]